MGFKFEIKGISRLEKAGVAVLDGRLLEGSITVGATAELIHGGQRLPIHIKGVVLGSVRPRDDILSIAVDLRQEAMGIAAVGDLILSASKEQAFSSNNALSLCWLLRRCRLLAGRSSIAMQE